MTWKKVRLTNASAFYTDVYPVVVIMTTDICRLPTVPINKEFIDKKWVSVTALPYIETIVIHIPFCK